MSFSQAFTPDLYITGDHYIFATTSTETPDTYIFVEDDINLVSGNSYLYFRNDAQLLQGTAVTGNSGIGQLSVYQNGTTHNYAYNYWCSPVGNTDTSDNANRAFRSNNNIYDVTTAPITSSLATFITGLDGTSSPLAISSRWLYSYNPGATYSDWDFIGDNGTAAPGYGFTMKGTSGSNNNQLYDFRGKPNNGTITVNVLSKEWTLVGNPYPSALDALDFIHDTQNSSRITGVLYYWEQDLTVSSHVLTDYVGGYASYTITSDGVTETFVPATFDTYNSNGSINTDGASSTSVKSAKRYIPIGQGFMVEGTADNTTVRTTNAHREYYKQSDSESQFFGPASIGIKNNSETNLSDTYQIEYDENGNQILPADYKRFRLNIDFNDIYTRQILQNFHDSATDGFDYGLEAKSPEGVSSDAYWIYNEEPYIAQAFRFNQGLKIPLVINVNSQQLIRFRIFDIQNFEANQTIYLHDLTSDVYTDLTQQNYEVNLETGNYSDRFEITFTNQALINSDVELNEINVFQNNIDSKITLLNPNSLKINEVSLFDVNGKQIFNYNNLSVKNKYEFSTQNLSNGVYLVSIRMENNTNSKKIIISNK